MNEKIELVKRFLADPNSVTRKELELEKNSMKRIWSLDEDDSDIELEILEIVRGAWSAAHLLEILAARVEDVERRS
jgi:hypothetical protein